jgi:hypothetical protein
MRISEVLSFVLRRVIMRNVNLLILFVIAAGLAGCTSQDGQIAGRAQTLASEATLAMNGEEFEHARTLLTEATKLKPDFERHHNEPSNPNHLQQQIFVLVLLGQNSQARQLLSKAQSRYPMNSQINRLAEGFPALRENLAEYIVPPNRQL